MKMKMKRSRAESPGEMIEEEEEVEEEAETVEGRTVITIPLLEQWEKQLRKKVDKSIIQCFVHAFHAAVERCGADVEPGPYAVEDSDTFNAVIRSCFTTLLSAWERVLRGLPDENEKKNQKGKEKGKGKEKQKGKWKRYVPELKIYLTDVVRLMADVQNTQVLAVVLRQISHLSVFFLLFKKLSKAATKQLIKVWSRKEESCRVLAFMNILKFVRAKEDLLEYAVKNMYLAYVENTKLVTPDTWPLINFMQRSYTEICGVNVMLAYRHAFLYIRQMAIHLRNAMISKKKELIQTVYNWQFVLCLYLWAGVLGPLSWDPNIEQLCYPLIQVTMGCAKLLPTMKYYPLRHHCVRILLRLMHSTDTYVPLLAIVVEMLEDVKYFNKRHTRQSARPISFDCLLKLSKSQMTENGTKDAILSSVEELLIESTHGIKHSIAFPEALLPPLTRLKTFTKECKIATYSQRIRALAEKIQEHCDFITTRRNAVAVKLDDPDSVRKLEDQLNTNDSPLASYHAAWKKTEQRKLQTTLEIEKDEKKSKKTAKEEKKEKEEKMTKKRKLDKTETDKGTKMKTKKKKKGADFKFDLGSLMSAEADVVQDLHMSDVDD